MKHTTKNPVFNCLVFLLLFLVISCDSATPPQKNRIPKDEFRYFRVYVENELTRDNFIVRTSDTTTLHILDSLLLLPPQNRHLHINGSIMRGNGGYNYSWSWRFKDNQWYLVENSIELCDAMPGYVEQHLDYFLDQLDGNFCPWGAEFDREMLPGELIE